MTTLHFHDDRMHLTEEGTALYVDAIFLDCPDALPEELRRHTEGCEACQRRVITLRELMKGAGYAPQRPHPYFDRAVREPAPRYGRYRWTVAAAALAVVAGGSALLLHRSEPLPAPPPDRTAAAPLDTAGTHAPSAGTPLLADAFAPLPDLDDLVQDGFRSGSAELIAPRPSDDVVPPVTFRWKDAPEASRVRIVTNTGKTVAAAGVTGESYVFRGRLTPGLYYWKLESSEELLAVGKFFVR